MRDDVPRSASCRVSCPRRPPRVPPRRRRSSASTSGSASPSAAASPSAGGSPSASGSAARRAPPGLRLRRARPARRRRAEPPGGSSSRSRARRAGSPASPCRSRATTPTPTGPMWQVTFAIQRATGAKRGTFVTITGGPGYAGVSAADDYADYWDPGIAEHYDIVFADQRGTGLSHQITCPAATSTYYGTDADPKDPADAAAVREGRVDLRQGLHRPSPRRIPADLPFYATSQAIEDLEAFRAVPRRRQARALRRELRDAVRPDLRRQVPGAHRLAVHRWPGRPRARTGSPTTRRPPGPGMTCSCPRPQPARRMRPAGWTRPGGDPMAAYDALIEKLDAGPIMVRFPTRRRDGRRPPAGQDGHRDDGRQLRLRTVRAVAVPARADRRVEGRLRADAAGLLRLDRGRPRDPQDDPGSDLQRRDVLLDRVPGLRVLPRPGRRRRAGRAPGSTKAPGPGSTTSAWAATYYGDMPCVYWPAQPKSGSAAQRRSSNAPYPTFIMTATSDPATPIANAMRLYGRLPDSYFIEALGGDHVIFGRGDDCPDKMITAYLVSGTLPATRVTTCPTTYVDEYVANARPRAADYGDALATDGLDGEPDQQHRRLQLPARRGPDHDGLLPRRHAAATSRSMAARSSASTSARSPAARR